MMILTKEIREQLIANGKVCNPDCKPVLKLFMPGSAFTWLISEMEEDGDTMFGLCDLGMGSPELGSVSLFELMSVKNRFGLGVERDKFFKADKSLIDYADAARNAGYINA